MEKDDYQSIDDGVYEEPDPLTRQQINQCMMDIQDMHPIAELAKYYHIIPCLKPLTKCKKKQPNFAHALRESILMDMNMSMPENDKLVEDDPFLLLGYGINSFFDLMYSLFWFSVFVTIFMMPLYIEFSQHDGLSKEPRFWANQFSLGNLGGTSINCDQHMIKKKQIVLQCYDGVISGNQAKFGILSKDLDKQTYCKDKPIWQQNQISKVANCTKYMNQEYIQKQLSSKKCNLQNNCKIDISVSKILNQEILQKEPKETQDQCDDSSNFYLQFACEIPVIKQQHRDFVQIVSLTVVLFVFFFSVLYMDYIDNVQALSFIDWDVKTITAGDYTIEFDLYNSTYEEWQNKYFDSANPMSENAQFKLFVQNYLENVINHRIPDQGNGYDMEIDSDSLKIAQITFAYENAALINILTKRGKIIGEEKWDKLTDINKEISDKLQDDVFMNDMQTPVSVFVTFETEEGHTRGTVYNDYPQADFLGQELDLQEASEPSDIIWQNRQFTPFIRNVKKIIVLIFIGIILSGSGASIYFMTVKGIQLKTKYPITDCTEVIKEYKGEEKLWESAAVNAHIRNAALEKAQKPSDYGETMQCFCRNLQDQKKPTNINFQNSKGQKAKICSAYFYDVKVTKAMGLAVAVFIVVVNQILQILIIQSVEWIGEDTHSQQLTTITNIVFIAQFFNTGLLLLLINANVSEHQPYFITTMFGEGYYDYVPKWYSGVGYPILQTMIVNAVKPLIQLFAGWFVPAVKRWLDRKRTMDRYITKKTSMHAYKQLYNGADYKVQVQYSQILNVAFITMFYGAQMPLLFPIAALSFIVNYVCQRWTVAYQVKLPAALDDRLTKLCTSILSTSCFVFVANGFWAYCNLQIFKRGAYHFIDTSDAFMKSGHLVSFNIWWIIFIVMTLVVTFLFKSMMQASKFDVNEDLPNFFHSISLTQADMMVNEEKHCQTQFGVLVNDPDTIKTLDEVQFPVKALQGTPWYTVLSNAQYTEDFGYIGAYIGEREKLIENGFADVKDADGELLQECAERRWEQSDMVFLLLNLAVIPDEVVKKCSFQNHGWAQKFNKDMIRYKENFEGDGEWKYQDADLEEKYAEFVVSQRAQDQEYQADHQAWKKQVQEFNEKKKDLGQIREMVALNNSIN